MHAIEICEMAMRDRMTPHLSRGPKEGVNTLILGHDRPFEAATAIYPEPMGIALVVMPKGNSKFTLVGTIESNAWLKNVK